MAEAEKRRNLVLSGLEPLIITSALARVKISSTANGLLMNQINITDYAINRR